MSFAILYIVLTCCDELLKSSLSFMTSLLLLCDYAYYHIQAFNNGLRLHNNQKHFIYGIWLFCKKLILLMCQIGPASESKIHSLTVNQISALYGHYKLVVVNNSLFIYCRTRFRKMMFMALIVLNKS